MFYVFNSPMYSCCNSSRHFAHKHPSYCSLIYCVSFKVSCTVVHWHLVNELALHSNGDWHRSQRTISCFWWIIFKITKCRRDASRLYEYRLCRARHTSLFHRAAWSGGYLIGYLFYMIRDYRLHIFAALVLYSKFHCL